MGIKRFFIIVASTIAFASGSAFAGLQGGSGADDYNSGPSNSGSVIPSDLTDGAIPDRPGTNGTEGQYDTSGNCATSASDSGMAGSACYGYPTGGDKKEDPSPSPTPGKDDSKKDAAKEAADKEAKERAAAEAAACRSQYQSALSSCEGSISSAGNSCDSSQSSELQSTAKQVDQAGEKRTDDTFALACGEAGGVSQKAKQAMSAFRQKCNGGLESCRASCGQLTSFLQSKPNCYEAIGHTSSSAQSLSVSKSASCESYQAKVNEADQSISNYASTAAGSAACQASATGGQSEQGATNSAQSPFCLSNPNVPGCLAATAVNCAADSSSLVCICSANAGDSRCSKEALAEASNSNSLIDPSSRMTGASEEVIGDLPNTPQIVGGRNSSSSDAKGIDGRQSTADLGGASAAETGGKSKADGLSKPEIADDDLLSRLAEFIGMAPDYSSGSGGSATSGASAAQAAADAKARVPASADAKDKNPDLRQFLPGGLANPGYSGITGSVRIGLDGITGPHSNIWQKIQNRYQVIQGTLEP